MSKKKLEHPAYEVMRRDWSFEAMQIPEKDDMYGWGVLGGWLTGHMRWQVVHGPAIQVEYQSCSRVGQPGDWVIKNGCGGLSIYSDEDFKQLFVPVIKKELDAPAKPM